MADDPKARTLANGIEVWCSYDKLVPVGVLKPNPRNLDTTESAYLVSKG